MRTARANDRKISREAKLETQHEPMIK